MAALLDDLVLSWEDPPVGPQILERPGGYIAETELAGSLHSDYTAESGIGGPSED